MSIIYDALQKTEQTLINRDNIPVKKSFFSRYAVDICLGIIIAGLIITVFCAYYPRLKNKLTTPSVKPEAAIAAAAPQPKKIKAVQQLKPSPPVIEYKSDLTLNGIFISDEEKIALINNQPFHIGDTIDGKKIISITPDVVKLGDKNHIYILRATA